jgi:glycosyltransferase involved in cell wall biosynthesis
MRIAMVVPSYPPRAGTCGVGDYTRCLARELARQGDDLSVVCAPGYEGVPDRAIRVATLPGRWTARRLARATVADVANVQYTPDLYAGRLGFALVPLALRRRGMPAVVTFHTLTGPTPASKVAAGVLLLTASHVISANEEVTAMIARRLPRVRARVTEIPIGANVPGPAPGDDGARGRALLGVAAGVPLLVHFGLVGPGKGLETLLDAVAILRGDRKVALAIVGDTRPESRGYRDALAARAAALGVQDAVLWAGRRTAEDVSRIIRAADVYVVPFDDGASIRRGSLVAGVALGVPVVSTAPAVPSAYLGDDNVALVPRRDPEALARRIRGLLDDPVAAARLAAAAGTLAARVSWPAIARDTRAVYARVTRR